MTEQGLRIRWGRIVVAAILSEMGVIAVLLSVIAMHHYLIAPGQAAAVYEAFERRASYDVAPPSAGVAVFLAALWVCRKLTAGFITHGLLVGAAAVVLSAGMIFTAEPDERFMYVVSFVLRIVGGYLAGVVAQRRAAPMPV